MRKMATFFIFILQSILVLQNVSPFTPIQNHTCITPVFYMLEVVIIYVCSSANNMQNIPSVNIITLE